MAKSPKGTSVFKAKWELECGVKVSSRNATTGAVENVICLFCQAFGREDPDETEDRKRKRTQNIQSFSAPWRIDKLKKHNNTMHSKKWAEYKTCSLSQKKTFFDAALEAKPALSYFKGPDVEKSEIYVDKDILETIIEDLLYFAEEDDTMEIEPSQKQDVIGFEAIHDENDEIECYRATISNSFQYQAIIRTVGNGLSFRQTACVLEDIRDMTGLGKIGNISRRKVTMQVRIYCAESFQIIADALRFYWAFSIALDGGNKASVSYLDFRLRLVLGYELFNIHLIAAPMYASHTGDNMFALCSKILDVLCPNWKEKVIGVTTDGASNMTGRYVEIVTQIQRLANDGFYRIWCAAHQLDLVVQDRFKSMFNETFVHAIQGITGHLRRQKNLIQRMKATCPRFIDSRCLSMGRLLNWLIHKRGKVQRHFDEKNPPCRPPKEWWIEVYALANVIKTVNITFKALQGKQLLLDQQKEHLEKLREELMRIGRVTSSGMMIEEIPGVFHVGSFRMTLESAELFLLNVGSTYVIDLVTEYKTTHEEEYKAMLERIVHLFLYLIHGVYILSPERNEVNGACIRTIPAVMPYSLAEAGSFQFSTALMEQRNRLRVSFSDQEIDDLELQFKEFETKYHRDDVFKKLVQNTSELKTFAEAWGWLYKTYPMLVAFAGGMATTFPGTSTVESDFSVIGWEKDEYRTMLSDHSLEGILHSKQKQEITSIKALLNKLNK